MFVFARLYPADSTGLAAGTIRKTGRYVAPEQPRAAPRHDERATTSPPEPDVLKFLPCYELRFDNPPRTSSGIVFGTDERSDIVLPHVSGVSRTHFAITFSKSPDNKYRLVVRDLGSRLGTEVRYDRGGHGRRKNFEWILDGFPGTVPESIVINVVASVEFLIVPSIPYRDRTSLAYFYAVQGFLQGAASPTDLLDDINLQSGPSTELPSQVQSPNSKSILMKDKLLGRGSFGEVWRFWDVSTGNQYACKQPLPGKRFDKQSWRDEISVLKRLCHDNVIRLEFWVSDPPQLFFEYVSGGSLNDIIDAVTLAECIYMLQQCLSALDYLHTRDKPVLHRDIKPENILVSNRDPYDASLLHVKLSDFGLAKIREGSSSTWGVGTRIYMAPEMPAQRGKYTPAIDIWSLGVVGLECASGLPSWHDDHQVWCGRITTKARSCSGDAGLLLASMLRIEPKDRVPARTAYTRAAGLAIVPSAPVLIVGQPQQIRSPYEISKAFNAETPPYYKYEYVREANAPSPSWRGLEAGGPSQSDEISTARETRKRLKQDSSSSSRTHKRHVNSGPKSRSHHKTQIRGEAQGSTQIENMGLSEQALEGVQALMQMARQK